MARPLQPIFRKTRLSTEINYILICTPLHSHPLNNDSEMKRNQVVLLHIIESFGRVIELLRLGLAEECEWGWTTTRPSGYEGGGRTEGRRRSAKNTCQFNWKSYSPPAVVESPILWYSTSSPVAPPPRRQSLATHNQPSAKHTIETMEWEAYINPLYYRYDGQWNSVAVMLDWTDSIASFSRSLPLTSTSGWTVICPPSSHLTLHSSRCCSISDSPHWSSPSLHAKQWN